jgi:hypothetical protein
MVRCDPITFDRDALKRRFTESLERLHAVSPLEVGRVTGDPTNIEEDQNRFPVLPDRPRMEPTRLTANRVQMLESSSAALGTLLASCGNMSRTANGPFERCESPKKLVRGSTGAGSCRPDVPESRNALRSLPCS